MEKAFFIKKSFWENLNPLSWHKSTILGALLGFYALFVPIFVLLGLQPVSATSVEAYSTAEQSSDIIIPSLALSSEIIDVKLSGKTLPTPATSVGRYTPYKNKIFLFGHSTTALKNLDHITENTEIFYDSEAFIVTKIETLPVKAIDMSSLLAPESEKTLILMTCSGEETFGKYPDRLIVTATLKTEKPTKNTPTTPKSDQNNEAL